VLKHMYSYWTVYCRD